MNKTQTPISEYLAGLTDGDGSIGVYPEPANDHNLGYRTRQRVSLEFYLSGLVDAEGCFGVYFSDGNQAPQTNVYTQTHMTMNDPPVDNKKTIKGMFDRLSIDYSDYEGRKNNDELNDTWRIQVTKLDSVKRFLERIAPHLVLKQPQAVIMLEQIIPVIERGDHRTQEGFLQLMAWRDVLNMMKGGTRGKYNLLYFENEWGIELNLERHGLPVTLREQVEAAYSG